MSRMPRPPRLSSPGRPRSQEAQRAVMTAARELFHERGYAAATIEAIADRSGVAKTTIYRRWPNRASLLVDVLVDMAQQLVPMPAGGEPLRAMRLELRQAVGAINGPVGRLLTALLGDAQQDPDVRNALVAGLFHPRGEASSGNIRRAQAAGALRADVPPHVAADLLFGPLFYRMFVGHQPVTDAFVSQVLKFVVEGLQSGRRSARRKPDRK